MDSTNIFFTLDIQPWSRTSLIGQASAALVAFLALVFIRRVYFSPIGHVPGPFLASFSRLWHLRQIATGKQNLKIIEQHDKYGHFVRIAHNEVSVCHPDAVKALLMTTLPKGDWYKIVCFPDYRFSTPFSMLDPKDKNECSRYLSTGYLQHNVVKSEPAMDENIAKLLSWMDRFADEEKPMDLDRFFTYVAFDITGEVIFSKPFGFTTKGADVNNSIAMNTMMECYIAFAGNLPHALHLLFANPLVTRLGVLPMGHLYDTTMRALAERAREAPGARPDLAGHWFRGLERAGKEGSRLFGRRCLEAFATANVGAGSDTVSAGLQSFVYHLLRHRGGWQRIRDEIRAAQEQGRCRGAVVSYDDAARLPYLQACIKEGMRVMPPIAAGLPRVAPRGGVTIGQAHFPEGVTLTVNPSVIHSSEELWGPDAREFVPERWFAPDAAERERRHFIPWGAGYASCPGQHVARLQLSKISATVVRDYDIRQVDGGAEWRWSAWFTCVPHDWPVYVEKRHESSG